MKFREMKKLGFLVLLSLWLPNASAFTFSQGLKKSVQGNLLTFSVNIPGISESGVAWNTAFSRAAGQWSMLTPVQINTNTVSSDPCAIGDRISGAGFSANLCGRTPQGSSGASAYAIVSRATNTLISEADISYEPGYDWDVYSGVTQMRVSPGSHGTLVHTAVQDFGRVTLHEVGHALGLGHSIFPRSVLAQTSNRDRDADTLTADDTCGVSISHGRPDLCPLTLPHSVTVTGSATTAIFVGGASSDRGASYKNVFNADETVDVMATVVVEDEHYGLSGRLHAIIELSDGTALMKTADGFAPWDGSVEALRANWLVDLQGANEIYVLESFNLKANGVRNIGVAVYVGYSLDSEPEQIYYSGTPIQFRID